jgi:hypothetical protein
MANPGLQVVSCKNEVRHQQHPSGKVFSSTGNVPPLCKTVKRLFRVPPVLVVWEHVASRTGGLASGPYLYVAIQFIG